MKLLVIQAKKFYLNLSISIPVALIQSISYVTILYYKNLIKDQKNKALAEEISKAYANIRQLGIANDNLTDRNCELEDENKHLIEKSSQDINAVHVEKEEMEEQLYEFQDKFKVLQNQIVELQNENTDAYSTINDLELRLQEGSNSSLNETSRISQLLQENRQLHEQVADLRSRLEVAEVKESQFNLDKKEDMRRVKSEYQASMEALSGSLEEMRETIKLQESSVTEALQERDDAKAALDKLRKHFVEFEEDARVAELEDMVELMNRKLQAQVETKEADVKVAITKALADSSSSLQDSNIQIKRLESIILEKDGELANLHSVIGQLTADSERASMNAAESAAARGEIEALQRRLNEAFLREKGLHDAIEMEISKRNVLEDELHRELEHGRTAQSNAIELRKALDDSLLSLGKMEKDQAEMVDRRVIAKLLVTYKEKEGDPQTFELLSNMLNLDDSQKRVVEMRRKLGVLGAVAGVPMAIVQGITADDEEDNVRTDDTNVSLVDAFVNFLNRTISDEEEPKQLEQSPKYATAIEGDGMAPRDSRYQQSDTLMTSNDDGSPRKATQGEWQTIAI